ncbi:hypothetical protein AVEN_40976-1 [Araneus ventricosus]|uniref:Uncharacterized protein n=1 Tax=Araneus ventricosus TaxID=182803 RepID=A0A4Y2F9D6_ARAVE|nr:hypothetical protein AVEN_40976-1 [Araneus ventricosus]
MIIGTKKITVREKTLDREIDFKIRIKIILLAKDIDHAVSSVDHTSTLNSNVLAFNLLNGSNISAECFENGPSVARWCTQIAPRFTHGWRKERQSKFSFPLCLLFRITEGYHLPHCPVA